MSTHEAVDEICDFEILPLHPVAECQDLEGLPIILQGIRYWRFRLFTGDFNRRTEEIVDYISNDSHVDILL